MAVMWRINLLLVFVCLILFTSALTPLTDFERKYTRTLDHLQPNPNCNVAVCQAKENGVLIYQKAKGDKDEIHHLFCTIGAPTIMMTKTRKGASMNVNYDILYSKNSTAQAVNFTDGSVVHSFGLIFSSLYEFNDTKDKADMRDTDVTIIDKHELIDLLWEPMVTISSDGYHEIGLKATARNDSHHPNATGLFKPGGYLNFKIRYDPDDGRLNTRPHMEHTANSTSVTLEMTNLTSNYAASRFAVEMIMFSTGEHQEADDSTQTEITSSLDDEYSPGVFEMRNWQANASKPREDAWGYAQWKNVIYTKTERLNADLSAATSYPNLPYNVSTVLENYLPPVGLFHSYFGGDLSQVSLNASNVSFGSTGDKYFQGTNYLVWTMAVGLGPPPTDDVSTMVILVIAVGLGIPLVLMIVSAVFVCVRSIKARRSSAYESING